MEEGLRNLSPELQFFVVPPWGNAELFECPDMGSTHEVILNKNEKIIIFVNNNSVALPTMA